MQIVNLHRQRMIEVAQTAKERGLQKALQVSSLDKLPSDGAHIPPHVRAVVQKSKLDSLLHSKNVYYAPIYAPALIYTSYMQENIIVYVFALLSLLVLPWSILAWIHKRKGWASEQVEKLFAEPFIFVDSARIYANFPELNRLEQQLSELEHMRNTAIQTSKSIASLAQKLKEKLILMGQDTNDETLSDLDNQYILQQRLIVEAESAIHSVENQRQQCLRLRQELFDWVELDWIKQEASQFSGQQHSEKLWRQAAEMELIAHDLNTKLSGVHGELGHALATWQTRNEVS